MRQVLIRHHIQSYTLTAQVLWGTGNAAIKSIFERFFFKPVQYLKAYLSIL